MAVSIIETTARPYSVEELLNLREDLPFVTCVVRNVNRHPDIAGILKLPEAALNDPDGFTCTSRTLADVINQRRLAQFGRRQTGGNSSEESEALVVSSVNLPRDTHRIQWHLRRRENSDRADQPHSAPSGIAAQQSENFQRFYRAVVSPTHVRVTAGGRIVPNTRATAPPIFEWNKDKFIFEQPKPSGEYIALQPSAWHPVAPVPVGFPPLLSSGFLPTYNTLPQGNNLAQATMAPQTFSGSARSDKNASDHSQPKASGEFASESTNNDAPPQQIKISHPSRFDQSKPFMYNGHVVYPLPAGLQLPPHALPVPLTVLGNPNYATQQPLPAPTFMSQQAPFSMVPLSNPYMSPNIGQHPLPAPSLGHPTENTPPLIPPYPRSGLATISEITKFQIQGFQSHLKHIDNQMVHNKHQIDAGYMAHQRAEVVATIAKMEAMLKAQLAHEKQPGPSFHQSGSLDLLLNSQHTRETSSNPGGQRNAKRSSIESSVLPNEETNGLVQALFSKPKLVPIQMSAPHDNLESTSKTDYISTVEPSSNAKNVTQSEPVVKSKLTAAAAMAPPFQPRTHAVAASSKFIKYPSSEVDSASLDVYSTPESQLHYSTPWNQYNSGAGVTYELGLQSMDRTATHSQEGTYPDRFEHSQPFHGLPTTVMASNSAPIIPSHSVPYLVGVLPQGVNIHEANANDLVYPRPLTAEEVRARYLYWGKAPRFVQSGLPKFDGKDFYPPSPTKETAHREPAPLGDRGNFHRESLERRKSFMESGNGYKTPSPVRTNSNPQDIIATPTQIFLENDVIGFQSPSPRPSTYRYEASLLSGPPVTHGSERVNYNLPTLGQHGNASARLDEDFSHLFMERGVAGYKSPTPPPQSRSNRFEAAPVTPTNTNRAIAGQREVEDGQQGVSVNGRWQSGDSDYTTAAQPDTDDTLSETSTVEINLTSGAMGATTNYTNEILPSGQPHGLASVDQQSQFLHSMLRNSTQTPMIAPALSGTVSSATAQGYLPQYRGAAAASLAPAAFADQVNGTAPLVASSFLPENRPLNRDRSPRLIRPSPTTMGAEGYMRYVSQKADEDKKILQQGWNAKTTATGPVMGSDW